MTDIDTLARHHAEKARDSFEMVEPPPILGTSLSARGRLARIPGPAWAVLAAIVVLIVVGLPYFLRDGQADQEPVVTITAAPVTIPEPPPVIIPEGSGGGFVPTDRLNSDCVFCRAILLEDGRVLVLSSSPQIYDQDAGTFATLDTPSTMGTSTITGIALDDGRALITDYVTQWLFDPATNAFLKAGDVAAWGVAQLGDGRVLLMGESRAGGPNSTFFFDPESGSTSQGPPTNHFYGDGSSIVALLDGRVLLLGSTTSEIFDPASDTFTNAGERMERGGFTATRLVDGRVLIVGGQEELEP
jgi:hypothetical protein